MKLATFALVLPLVLLGACAGPQALPTVEYLCTDRSALRVTYHKERALVLLADGYSVDLPQQRTGSGFQYADERHDLRGKGQEVSFTLAGRPTLYCKASGA